MRSGVLGCWSLILALALPVAGCGDDASTDARTDARTGARMRDALQQIARTSPRTNPYLETVSAERLRDALALLPPDAPADQRFQALVELAREEIRLGNNETGVAHYDAAHELATGLELGAEREGRLAYERGLAWLRRAEEQNCRDTFNVDRCVFPIQGAGLHEATASTKAAADALRTALAKLPAHDPLYDASAWLLNVASMGLGTWPEGVPEGLRVSRERLAAGAGFKKFRNIAPALGLDVYDLAGGAVVDDFDGDGDLDVMTTSWDPLDPMHCFRNEGDGTFRDVTKEAGLEGMLGGLNMVQADHDNDGDIDILVLRGAWLGQNGWHPNSLLENDGKGRFTDVTFEAGLGRAHYPTQTAAWADYDGDGDLDLYVGNESVAPYVAPCQLFRNKGDGTYEDVAEAAGVRNEGYTKGVVWGDYDGDGDPDLFVSNYRQPNRLYRNDGEGRFTDVAAALGVDKPLASFPAWFFDYDNDGVLDLFVASYAASVGEVASYYRGAVSPAHPPALFRGNGRGGFVNHVAEAGLARPMMPMGSNFGDLDGDGRLDLFLGTGEPDYAALMPNLVFAGRAQGRFEDVTIAGGFGSLQKGHAVAIADFDHDGDLDVFQQQGGAFPGDRFRNALYENPGFGHAWLTLLLEGRRSNRSAIGARIQVDLETPGGTPRTIYRHVGSGGSFGASPLRQTLGLGQTTRIRQVSVLWPTTGKTQVFEKLETGKSYRIVEGESEPRPLPLAPIPFRTHSSGHGK